MKFGSRLLSTLAICAVPLLSHAGDYPSKPITFIVPWQAGGSIDAVMRAMAQSASKTLGQPIVVDNKPGAGGTLGPAAMAAKEKPDGYTIAQVGAPLYRLPLIQKTNYDPEKDFTYIVNLAGITFGITAAPHTAFKSWADVVDYAKKNPGKLSYASPGQNTTPHLGMEQISALAGIQLTHVPFKSSPETNTALLGGHVDLQVDGAGFKPLVDSGRVKLLAVWTSQRTKRWPDAPTLKDLGYPLVIESPIGIAGPKGMDPKVVSKLHDAFRAALEDPDVRRTMAEFEFVPAYQGSEDFAKFVVQSRKDEKAVLNRLGVLRADLK
ncbi:MAG: tripartite tricarboxylate transporter substrate binding protein [Proteobacteria bacterium]|nr:tripartite tricarboxylate transporter substrate binding protein [Pseudomonadota bacterium]MBS0492868.1 tripartite tricarboxylate transporter substrate binding protein [Pseudomonadota bacterium]